MMIEVAYALPDKQYLLQQEVAEGTTVAEALKASELLIELPDLDISQVGIFAQPVKHDRVLQEKDRIEVYRPLKVDPKERRRQKVEKERQQAE